MPLKLVFIFMVFFSLLGFLQKQPREKVKVDFINQLHGDFSFAQNWSYPLGVERKEDGKAGCADGGFCPERCYNMLDSNGIVLKDSATLFYRLLDTSHLYHTLLCEANAYEFAGADYFHVYKDSGKFFGFSETGIATHSSLELDYRNGRLKAFVVLNSIMQSNGKQIFNATSGYLKIDRTYFNRDTLKAFFDFQFYNHLEPKNPLWWKGWIYSPIQTFKKQ